MPYSFLFFHKSLLLVLPRLEIIPPPPKHPAPRLHATTTPAASKHHSPRLHHTSSTLQNEPRHSRPRLQSRSPHPNPAPRTTALGSDPIQFRTHHATPHHSSTSPQATPLPAAAPPFLCTTRLHGNPDHAKTRLQLDPYQSASRLHITSMHRQTRLVFSPIPLS